MPKKNVSQVVRQWQVLQALEERPSTLEQLALDSNVNPRTIRRDLEALQEAQFPIYNEQLDDLTVRWHLLRKFTTPPKLALLIKWSQAEELPERCGSKSEA